LDDLLWYKDAVLYEVYVRAFNDSNGDGHGDLRGLIEKLDYLDGLGVTCLWLLPIHPSPLKDDGYDVANYYGIHTSYGNLEDFQVLIREAHSRRMRVIMDLVLNHTSDQHPWFRASRANPRSVFHDYYVWSATNQKYTDAGVIFHDTETSNWAWDAEVGKYYWHRFYTSQPDLNYDNPRVQQEMLNVISFWLDLGVDGFRADAVPYLFERENTICKNLPKTHAYLKKIRQYINRNYPGRVLIAEANEWPEDVLPYFGSGQNEFHMGFHFPLMPRIFLSLRKGDSSSIEWSLKHTPLLNKNCQWCLFLRNHDELTLEMVTPEEREWMWQEYAPEPRMRINTGIRRRLAPLLDNDLRKIEIANSLLFTLPGTPVIYYGDEIGMGDNISLFDRNGVRTPMQWNGEPGAGFSEAPIQSVYAPIIDDEIYGNATVNVAEQLRSPASLLNKMRSMIAVRRQHQTFGRGNFRWVDVGTQAIAAYQRRYKGESLFIINNLSDETQDLDLPSSVRGSYRNLITKEIVRLRNTYEIPSCGYAWLRREN